MNATLCKAILAGLSLRYRVRTTGLDEVARKGTRGILFLPTHPAYVDPLILTLTLSGPFAARPFADQDAIDNPMIRWGLGQVRAFQIPSVARHGAEAGERIGQVLVQAAEALRQGDNVILYPAGRLLVSRLESVSGTSAVETIVRAIPEVRIVLVKTRGLWGSRFSTFYEMSPSPVVQLKRSLLDLAASGLFWMPRRAVEIGFEEPADFPRHGTRHEINAFIEAAYNRDAPAATFVPYRPRDGTRPHEMPDPERGGYTGDLAAVSAATREIVTRQLKEMAGVSQLPDSANLATDLNLDSLKRGELLLWIESQFGFPQGNTDSLQTVADVMLAAAGQAVARSVAHVDPPGASWTAGDSPNRVEVAPGATVAAAFLAAAKRDPSRAVVADQRTGVKTFRDLVTGILALLPGVSALPGDNIGVMLPATVAAGLAYLTVQFAGRTPVMINWTVGRRNLEHAVEVAGLQSILTVKPLVQKCKQQGLDLSAIESRLVYLEDLGAGLTRWDKLRAFVRSWVDWSPLRRARITDTAAVLFTSGSENLPKAVPLSHVNVMTDLRDTLSLVEIRRDDKLLGMLPPFHSFGLTIGLVAPLTTGIRTVYHANPTEGPLLGQILEAYKGTIAVATPTFLQGILRGSEAAQLSSVRLAVVGAEACPARVYELLAERCPKAIMLEGYGITECSPIVALNTPEDPRAGTIGRLIPSLSHLLLDPESGERVDDKPGMLYLSGPTIFGGYLGGGGDPFVEQGGRRWYKTGDIVRADPSGIFSFVGRLKRFVKLGGEMISLPAIESALLEKFGSPSDEGPIVAVVPTPNEPPELVLFTTLEVDREGANAVLKASGLSALYNLRRVERVDAIPLLGTGKTDYRSLGDRL